MDELPELKIGFIGAGNMAYGIAKGILKHDNVVASNVIVSAPSKNNFARFQAMGVAVTHSNEEVIHSSRLVFLAVKPHLIPTVLSALSQHVTPQHTVVSMAAGVTLATLEGLLPGGSCVIRLMPNLPCMLQEGALLLACGTGVKQEVASLLKSLFSPCGLVEVGPESWIDAHTGLSGSGVAFVYVFAEALAEGAVKMGMPSVLAQRLAAQTILKPLYDRAEAMFYQNLYCVNEPQSTPNDKQACAGHPRAPAAERAKSDKTKEKKPSNDGVQKGSSALCHFLHADSERVWLEHSRYAEAETRFYEAMTTKTGCSLSRKMSAMECLAQERIWFDKSRYDEAERNFYERMNGPTLPPQDTGANSILQDIARARENIQKSLAGLKTTLQPTTGSAYKSLTPSHSLTTAGGSGAEHGELLTRMKKLELENQSLQKMVEQLRSVVSNLESRVSVLEKRPAAPAAVVNGISSKTGPPPPQKTPPAPIDDEDDDDDDDMDLFGSDDEVDEEAERLKEQRLQEYAAKKAKKPAIIAKSSILLDVKPWDDETDMAKMEECVRSIQVDGLLWGASKLVPVGYGIKKLQINCVVEDDKVGTDLLEEEITKFED
ncbi:hypothetical protein QTP70_029088 [Hemibagrus guttatus]|uniref:pyrroline-5-carboxylate reductase n=1 Tax=Hemibagrus guttatus TaxID=175788 RepID=A0AAE0PRF2_9TELE|nr:hypothetical protein QTP70_029088 [Hemibagrus guttatus]